jgi:hypothetical protein
LVQSDATAVKVQNNLRMTMSLVGTKKDKRWSKKNGITMHIPRAISFYPKTSIYYDI